MAKRSLVAFLTFLLAFGATPAQLWAEGVEGIAQAAEDAAEPAPEAGDATSDDQGETPVQPAAPAIPAPPETSGDTTGDAEGAGSGSDASQPAETPDPVADVAATDDAGQSSTIAGPEGPNGATAQDSTPQAASDEHVVSATVQVIGVNADGADEAWSSAATIELPADSTAADLSEALFKQAGLAADYGDSTYGWSLNTITSPTDGRVLGWDAATGKYWQLFVNGVPSELGAGSVELKAGDTVTWYYSAFGATLPELKPSEPNEPERTVSASIEVIGVNADGEAERWAALTSIELPAGSTAADLSEALFKQVGITADYGESTWGWSLNTITSPFDGRVLGWDDATQKYWQLFVNGKSSSVGAGSVELKAGDTVSWVYSAYGEEKPDGDDVVIDPDAQGPEWGSDWPGYTQAGSATDASTPSGAVTPSWVADDIDGYLSDPIVVNGRLYVTSGSKLYAKDAKDGKTLATGQLVAKTDSISRMVYTDGLIIVPLSGGRLQALTADTLVTKWATEALAPTVVPGEDGKDLTYDQQALSTLTVRDGYVYFGTAAADWSGSYGGWLACVKLSDGTVTWTRQNDKSGYYWSGAASVGDYLAIAGDDGKLQTLDPATGKVAGELDLGAPVRSTVLADGSTAYVVTNDGVLHRVSVGSNGSPAQTGSVDFGFSSTSMPSIAGGKLFVGGATDASYQNAWGSTSHYGALFVIDVATMKVEAVIDSFASGKFTGDVKSAPLVSEQADGTYVYFTVNAEPGGVYRYKLGDARAQLIYVPDEAHRNYSMSSVVCDANGNLYYVNDSGALFSLTGAATGDDDLTWKGDASDDGTDDGGDHNNGGTDGNGGDDSHNGNGGANGAGGSGNGTDGHGVLKPSGTVTPASKPLAAVQKTKKDATSAAKDGDKAAKRAGKASQDEKDGNDEKATRQEAARADEGTDSKAEADHGGTPVLALVAGAIGLIGLIAAGCWTVLSKRREGSDAQ